MTSIVSIIIPVYNRPVLVAEAIESVLAQTIPNWELIVVDDGSTDNTWEVLESYAAKDERIRVFKRDREPKGAPTCRNFGAGFAKGQYLIFFDSDDLLLPYCVENRLRACEEYPEMNFLVFPMAYQNNRGELVEQKIPDCEFFLDEFLAYRLHWGIMCPIWKKDFFQKLGGFNENLPRLNDPEFMIRALLEVNDNFIVLNDALPDTIYFPNKKFPKDFKNKVRDSLIYFVSDISSALLERGQNDKTPLLKAYLRMWFDFFFFPLESSRVFDSIKIVKVFAQSEVISRKSYISLVVLFFFFSATNFLNFRIKKLIFKKLKD